MSTNVIWHESTITKDIREQIQGHRSAVIWLTGLSGSGKSTLANEIDRQLFNRQFKSYVLDGDNIRHGLNKDLSFTEADRKENIRRIGEVAKLFVDSGHIVTTAFISPFIDDRHFVRSLFTENEFIEVYVKCPLDICELRDPKGLYVKARQQIIPHFTGVSSPYEEPVNPEITIDTNQLSIEVATEQIIHYLETNQFIPNLERSF